jgi:hypothetical protein
MSKVYYMNTGPWPYFIGFTTDQDAFKREMRRLKVKEPVSFFASANAAATTHSFTSGGTAMAIVCIAPPSRKQSKEQYAALIAHEATHVVQDMRENLGDLGREAEAYLVQQVVQEALQIAWRTNRTIRKAPVP